ncbi:MAG TPA: hypothetical protein EYO73_09805 [Sulfurimonas sp.]|nr:hypothetical protein [Sulfurimonas sp.]
MSYSCPNHCTKKSSENKFTIKKDGVYFRKSDSRMIQRFLCQICGKRFSNATFSPCYRQKKRRVNEILFKLLSSGVSMRRAALILNIHRTTVKRKLEFLAKRSKERHEKLLKTLEKGPVTHLQFDDLITIEHTKLKPLSVSIAVDAHRRIILGAEVSKIPAFGLLAEKSRQKYGRRPNHHAKGLSRLFNSLLRAVDKNALIKSDEHQRYPEFVKKFFPSAVYKRYKGARGAVVGQGELKKIKRDPLFMLNHTCAMFRANVNRPIRKTWCTTKDPGMLQKHLFIYMDFHNSILVR